MDQQQTFNWMCEELARLRAALAEAERERDEARETAHYANGVADLARQHRNKAEADLADAREPYRNADEKDWAHLHLLLGYNGHGQFWKAVFKEVRAFLERTATPRNENGPKGPMRGRDE